MTLDLLKEAGYSHMLDWPADDQPFWTRALRRALEYILRHRDSVWLTTPSEIARYCMGLPPGTVP